MHPVLQAKADGFPDKKANPKWQALHSSLKPVDASKSCCKVDACSSDKLFLHLPRERDAWTLLASLHPQPDLVADLSQTVTRAGVRKDGKLPTITPGSVLAVKKVGRLVSPMEKIMLHGFPVHRMIIPSGISDRDLESMGGNTMHVHVVGAAMLMVLAMVDWSSAAASGPCHGLPRKAKNAGTTIYQSKMRRGPRSTVHGLKCRKSQVTKVLANLAARWQMPKGKPVIN